MPDVALGSGSAADDGPLLLRGPGEVRALMRRCNWAATSLGPPEEWAPSLRAIVRVILTSRFAMWMAWGPDLTFICNDAYLPTVGLKRDWVIGSRSDKVWAEIWPDIGPRIQHVLKTGEATWDEALLLYLERSGYTEETYHTFSYSPVSDDAGVTAGMLCVVAEVTERVIGERQLSVLRDVGATLAAASTRAEVMTGLERRLAAGARDVPFAVVFLNDGQGVPQRAAVHDPAHHMVCALPHLDLTDPAAWPLDQAADGQPILIDLDWRPVDQTRQDLTADASQEPSSKALGAHGLRQALIAPIAGAEGEGRVGYLIAGLNPHRAFDAGYQGFIELLTAQLAAAVARADEYERARERADALAEIDRAKTAFFSNVSHEFRTPLTLMLGPLDDALSGAEAISARQRARLEIAHRNALRLLRLVNSLLDFARIEAGRAEATYVPTDLAALTADLASSFRAATDRAGLRLKVDTPPLSRLACVDPNMWETIVLNLLSNAFKFTFEGEISVTLRERDGAQGRGPSATLTVRDTGVGIPASQIDKLFDRFHRVEGAKGRSFEGSGIGLALVRELVKLHDGDIAVDSEEGRGTAFHVTIPLGQMHLSPERIPSAPAVAATAPRSQTFVEEALRWLPDGAAEGLLDGGAATDRPQSRDVLPTEATLLPADRRRVLLADDNADLRDYIGRLLADHGYQVQTAPDGEAALAAVRAARPDILLTDVMMPKLDGFGLLAAIREDPELRDLPIVMLSARAGDDAKVEGLQAGADDYLTKPFSARELLARITANIAMAKLRRDAAAAVSASETRAREEAERVQLALDAGAIIGTWIWTVPTNQVVGDERFARAFALDPARCRAGLPLAEAMASIHEEDRAAVGAEIEAAVRRGGPYRCEFRVRQDDGVFRWVEANGRVEQDETGQATRFPGVLIDIDHRRAIEAALRQLNQDLETRVQLAIAQREQAEDALRQSQKMEAVGQLTGGIAHDFNNLLTGISGSLQMLDTRIAQGRLDAAPRYIDAAQGAAKRAAALTQRLLAFSCRQTLDPKPTNLNRLISDMEELVRRTTGPNIDVEVVGAAGLWPIMIDQNQLENALLNLCINARDAMPDGGRLTIETANLWLDAESGLARDTPPGQYVSLCVADTGIGMSKETIDRIFEPFFTTKPLGQGTGLGLSMIYGFIRQSNGYVRVYSEPGQGTTMCLYLPRLAGEAVESELTSEGRPGFETGHGETVLVIDDEPSVRLLTVDVLQEAGYGVLEAADGPAGLRILQSDTRIDLLITDVGLPGGMNGRQVADAGRALRPQLKVLFITGYAENAVVGNGHLDPGMQVITKPFAIDALANRVRAMIDGTV
jgi:signal transduction histidine kinase/DNA-binding response OmpR family regulator